MAFMGIFLVALVVIFAVLGFSTFISIVSFVLYFIFNKKGKKIKILFLILGTVFIMPLLSFVGLIIYSTVSTEIENRSSFTYNVMNGNYSRVEKMLKNGVSPDCSIYTDEEAVGGDMTELACLVRYGFVDTYDLDEDADAYAEVDPLDDQDKDEVYRMVELLLEYGADVDHVTYINDTYYSNHEAEEESDYYMSDDGCGRTPFLWAVDNNDLTMAKILVEYGADVNAVDMSGFGALQIVADASGGLEETGTDMLEYLTSQGLTYDGGLTNFGQELEFLVGRQNGYGDYYRQFFDIIGYEPRY